MNRATVTVYINFNVMVWEGQVMPRGVQAWVDHMENCTMGDWRN